MRCLQANLSYLAASAERPYKPAQPIHPGPAVMSPPATTPELVELYGRLQPLFPGWKGGMVKPSISPRGSASS